jgi:hypothetical protein
MNSLWVLAVGLWLQQFLSVLFNSSRAFFPQMTQNNADDFAEKKPTAKG